MRKRSHVLEPSAEQSWRNPAGKVENPAWLWSHTGFKEISMESQNAAAGELSLAVDRKQERVGIHIDIERVGGEVTGVDVIHDLVGVQRVEEQVQQFNEWIAVGRVS